MASRKKSVDSEKSFTVKKPAAKSGSHFHLEFMNHEQKTAYSIFDKHEVTFISGVAGCGKTMVSIAYAVQQLLTHKVKKIVIARPLVESGEKMGYLPGGIDEKVLPYMMPIYDCIDELVNRDLELKKEIMSCIETIPIAFCRGRTFRSAVAILDEAQNATASQLKLFLTRIGNGGKMIINGDPTQIDLPPGMSGFASTMEKLKDLPGIGSVTFSPTSTVRHPLIAKMLERI